MSVVGFIGLGRMGSQLALNLLKGGFSVVGCDIAPRPALADAGVTLVASPAEVAKRAKTILHSLPGVGALEAVLGGPDGLLAHCNARHIIADLSAYPLAAKTDAARRMSTTGATFLDCQISGVPEMLVERRGVIFASGDEAAAQKCFPLFAAMVSKHYYIGPFGTATRLKTVNNMLTALHTWAAGEAMTIVTRSGIDPRLAVEVLGSGASRSELLVQRAELMAARNYDNKSSTLQSFTVFLDLIDDAVKELGIKLPLASVAVAGYRQAIASMPDKGMTAVYDLINPPAK